MGFHSKCNFADKCRYGSETEHGTCGYSSCRRNELFERADNGDITSHFILVNDNELPKHGSRRNKNNEIEYW